MGRNPSDQAIDGYWSQAGGSLSYEQFCLVMRREKKASMNDLMRAFRRIDSNGDGFVSVQELQKKLTKVCYLTPSCMVLY
jgi:Ca2+-binding EF-hand superfamily protein